MTKSKFLKLIVTWPVPVALGKVYQGFKLETFIIFISYIIHNFFFISAFYKK